MSKKELIKYLISNNVTVPVTQILMGMLIALLLSVFIYWIYRKTYTGVGLSCGTGIYTIGILSSALIAGTLLIFHKGASFEENSYLLIVRGTDIDVSALEWLLKTEVKRFHLRMTNHSQGEEEYTYEILLKGAGGDLVKRIVSEFQGMQINLLSYRGELSGEA